MLGIAFLAFALAAVLQSLLVVRLADKLTVDAAPARDADLRAAGRYAQAA